MSDLFGIFVNSEEEHNLRRGGADFLIFKNRQNYSLFREKNTIFFTKNSIMFLIFKNLKIRPTMAKIILFFKGD